MAKVWESSKQSGSKLLLMLALADHANESGICWPGIESLAEKVRLSERHTKRLIQELIDEGEIEVEHGCGRGNTSMYRLLLPASKDDAAVTVSEEKPEEKRVTPASEKVTSPHKRVTPASEKGDIAVSPEPSRTVKESSTEPSEEGGASPASVPEQKTLNGLNPPEPKRESQPKQRDKRTDHPAIQAIKQVRGRYPPKKIYDRLIQAIGDEPDTPRLEECFESWCLCGYNTNSLIWAVEWYVTGIPDRAKPNGGKSNGKSETHRRGNRRRSPAELQAFIREEAKRQQAVDFYQ